MSENVMTENLQPVTPQTQEKPTKLRRKKKVNLYFVMVYIILGIFSLVCFFPLIYVVLLSFSTEADWMTSTLVVFPKHFHMECQFHLLSLGLGQ